MSASFVPPGGGRRSSWLTIGILPDSDVIGIAQTCFPYMNAFGIDIGQQEREAWREILVKQQFHVLAA